MVYCSQEKIIQIVPGKMYCPEAGENVSIVKMERNQSTDIFSLRLQFSCFYYNDTDVFTLNVNNFNIMTSIENNVRKKSKKNIT